MRTLLYFADPMCSWCWGFAPVMQQIVEHYGGQVPVSVLMGGLRVGVQEPWDARSRIEIRNHWQHVQQATGQPFDFSKFDNESFVYDCEPACRAVVAVRRMDFAAALPFLESLQAAFYRDNRDITREDELLRLVRANGLDTEVFSGLYHSGEAAQELVTDFQVRNQLGIQGFPTLIGSTSSKNHALTVGYSDFENVSVAIERWLKLTPA
ncbi:DsbA family protein [Biformimicrobium ophioploci]|uniref:DsbA family protein n=1 Tax=Biformimicrobium ophioploci TaxID=3036711 RepID=A0ABQ6LZB6_9GAMM|nr:DsbA family protein [Microbulbifer sp. NKW57]GMG87380.1 DsbA family protein [Microbulbifer sp. NKW57]